MLRPRPPVLFRIPSFPSDKLLYRAFMATEYISTSSCVISKGIGVGLGSIKQAVYPEVALQSMRGNEGGV